MISAPVNMHRDPNGRPTSGGNRPFVDKYVTSQSSWRSTCRKCALMSGALGGTHTAWCALQSTRASRGSDPFSHGPDADSEFFSRRDGSAMVSGGDSENLRTTLQGATWS